MISMVEKRGNLNDFHVVKSMEIWMISMLWKACKSELSPRSVDLHLLHSSEYFGLFAFPKHELIPIFIQWWCRYFLNLINYFTRGISWNSQNFCEISWDLVLLSRDQNSLKFKSPVNNFTGSSEVIPWNLNILQILWIFSQGKSIYGKLTDARKVCIKNHFIKFTLEKWTSDYNDKTHQMMYVSFLVKIIWFRLKSRHTSQRKLCQKFRQLLNDKRWNLKMEDDKTQSRL